MENSRKWRISQLGKEGQILFHQSMANLAKDFNKMEPVKLLHQRVEETQLRITPPERLAALHKQKLDRTNYKKITKEKLKPRPVYLPFRIDGNGDPILDKFGNLVKSKPYRNPNKVGGIKLNNKNIRKHGVKKLAELERLDRIRWNQENPSV